MMDVGAMEADLGKPPAQLARDPDRGARSTNRVNFNRRAHLTGEVDHEARDVARTGCETEASQLVVRTNPAPEEMPHQAVTPKIAINRSQIAQVGDQLLRHRLRP